MSFSLITPRKGHRIQTNVTVGGTAVKLADANKNRKSITLQNKGGGTCYLGGPDVTTSGPTQGYALFTGATLVDNASDEEWWAISGGSYVVGVTDVI
jgi:hypothetical protein